MSRKRHAKGPGTAKVSTASAPVLFESGQVSQVDKARMATSIDWPLADIQADPKKRGVTVYNTFELMSAAGRLKDGSRLAVTYQLPIFVLTVSERIDMFRLCSPVFAVVQGRANRIAGMEWAVTKDSKDEDRIVEELRRFKALLDEFEGQIGPRALGIRIRCRAEIFRRLGDLRDDLGNFDASILRWSKRVHETAEDKCSEIEDWLNQPNQEDSFEEFNKKLVLDQHIHGAAAIYKELMADRVENVYVLPGGTVYPVKGRFVGEATGFIQLVDNFDPQIMMRDEVSFIRYGPRSDSSYGSVPLEALVNKVAETLMFDQRAAEMADGTKAPEKLVIMGDKAPFGNIGTEFDMPLPSSEQRRLEQTFNEQRKDAIRLISGYGAPVVVDISRADTFGMQNERQRMVREEVGMVFGASNQEMNLTGSESTSGRNSADAQERYDLYKGIFPALQNIEAFWNSILPFRFGTGYKFAYNPATSEAGKVELLRAKKDSGLYSVNEIRTKDMGEDPFKGDEFNVPASAASAPAVAPVGMGLL